MYPYNGLFFGLFARRIRTSITLVLVGPVIIKSFNRLKKG